MKLINLNNIFILTIFLAGCAALFFIIEEKKSDNHDYEDIINVEFADAAIASCSLFHNMYTGGWYRVVDMLKFCYKTSDANKDESYESVKMCIVRDILYSQINTDLHSQLGIKTDPDDYANEENMLKRVFARLIASGLDEKQVFDKINNIKKLATKSTVKSFEYCHHEIDQLNNIQEEALKENINSDGIIPITL